MTAANLAPACVPSTHRSLAAAEVGSFDMLAVAEAIAAAADAATIAVVPMGWPTGAASLVQPRGVAVSVIEARRALSDEEDEEDDDVDDDDDDDDEDDWDDDDDDDWDDDDDDWDDDDDDDDDDDWDDDDDDDWDDDDDEDDD